MTRPIDWRLCLVADTRFRRGIELLDLVMAVVERGAGLVQLRAKSLPDREALELSLALATKLSKARVPLIVNDRPDLALAGQASGVHLGQEDLPLPYARGILGASRLIGISVTTVEEARRAWHEGADYVGAGPVFATSTKTDACPPIGLDGLRRIRDAVRIPVLAIGGIGPANARSVVETGVDGLAVVSAVLAAPDPAQAAGELLDAFGRRP
jgi:thiamine-phosphate pyrophosphorylase